MAQGPGRSRWCRATESIYRSFGTRHNPITGETDSIISRYIAMYVTPTRVGDALDNSSTKELVERGMKYAPARKFLEEMAERGFKALFGPKAKKVLGKRVPIIGTARTLYFLWDDIEARGAIGGLCNSGIDAIPVVGAVKGAAELSTGSNLVETYEDAEIRNAAWELFDEKLRLKLDNPGPQHFDTKLGFNFVP